MNSKYPIIICEDCGAFIYLERLREVRQCHVCDSKNLIHGFTQSPPVNVVFASHHGSGLFRPKTKLTDELLKSHRRKVREAPGTTLLRIADFLYSPATVEKIFKQEIADWRVEYYEAVKNNQTWKARWISCRHYWAIAKAVSLDRVVTWFDRVLRRI